MAGTVRKRIWTDRKGDVHSRWLADYFDQNRRRHTRQFKSKKAADAWLLQARGEIRDGTHTPDSASITVTMAAQAWLDQAEIDGLERSTREQYRQHVDHILPQLGMVKLSQLTVATIKGFRNELITAGHSRVMAKKVVSSLGSVLANAQSAGLVAQNVVRAEVQQNKTATRRRRLVEKRQARKIVEGIDYPTKDELRRIITVPGRWHALVVTAILAGLRASELRGLRWCDVNFAARQIEVRQRADRYNVIGPLKSAAARREIPMGPYLINALKEWRLACPKGPLDLVFPNTKGKLETLPSIHNRGLAPLQRDAGIIGEGGGPRYGMHSLRHAAASLWIETEAPKRVQYLMGHATIALTFDVYGHLWQSDETAAAEAIEQRLIG